MTNIVEAIDHAIKSYRPNGQGFTPEEFGYLDGLTEALRLAKSFLPEKGDPYLPLRTAIAHLSANELHQVAEHLMNHKAYLSVLQGADPKEEQTLVMCDALSHFATNGIKE